MRQKKLKKRIIACLTLSILLLSCTSYAHAANDMSQKTISPNKMQEWDNGALVTSKTNGEGKDFSLSVAADTSGLVKGNYTVYMFSLMDRSPQDYDGMRFHFKNGERSPLKINLVFNVDSDTSVSLTDDSFVILEADSQGINESVAPGYGTLTIPAGFDGTIYVPFSQLYTAHGKQVSLTKIQSWGITSVMTQDQTIHYSMGNIALLENSVSAMKDSYYFITVSGSDKIESPTAGSVLDSYQAKVRNLKGHKVKKKMRFYLEQNVKGASISEDGTLEVTSACKAKEIRVCAKTENSINAGVFTTAMVRGRASETVPNPAAMQNIESPVYAMLGRSINRIRIVAAVVALCLSVLFMYWFSTSNTNYMTIKKKLYEILKR